MKRATKINGNIWGVVIDFNPRPREEGDGKDLSIIAIDDDFNPRPREEGDKL